MKGRHAQEKGHCKDPCVVPCAAGTPVKSKRRKKEKKKSKKGKRSKKDEKAEEKQLESQEQSARVSSINTQSKTRLTQGKPTAVAVSVFQATAQQTNKGKPATTAVYVSKMSLMPFVNDRRTGSWQDAAPRHCKSPAGRLLGRGG